MHAHTHARAHTTTTNLIRERNLHVRKYEKNYRGRTCTRRKRRANRFSRLFFITRRWATVFHVVTHVRLASVRSDNER